MVVPERDRPGSTAKHWPMPTISASSQVAFFSVLCFFGAFSDRNRIAAVTRSISPTTRDEENAPSILLLIGRMANIGRIVISSMMIKRR